MQRPGIPSLCSHKKGLRLHLGTWIASSNAIPIPTPFSHSHLQARALQTCPGSCRAFIFRPRDAEVRALHHRLQRPGLGRAYCGRGSTEEWPMVQMLAGEERQALAVAADGVEPS